jgi:hypothetical protein
MAAPYPKSLLENDSTYDQMPRVYYESLFAPMSRNSQIWANTR